MRDSALKRLLVNGYFSWRELLAAARGIFKDPEYSLDTVTYDSYWQRRGPGGVHPRFDIIARHLGPSDSVLDIGCGDGAMLEYFFKTKSIRGLGIDISEVAVEKAKERGVDARTQDLADFCVRSYATFDHVVISEVLEHLGNSEDYVRQGWLLARKTLWLTFPNIAYLPHRLRLLAGRFPVQWAIFPSEHLRFWSVPDFRVWLKQLGMKPSKIYASNGITVFGLHRLWPNLLSNQCVVKLDKS